MGTGGTVAYVGLQILLYLGFDEVYIIGMDMDYKIHETASVLNGIEIQSNDDDDPNHFDPRYFGKGKKYHQPVKSVMDHMLESLKLANDKFLQSNTKLFNATLGGVVECFKRVNFYSLFGKLSDTDKEALFLSSFHEKINSIEDIDKQYSFLPEPPTDKVPFSIEAEKGIGLISKLIYDYIPYGPFNNKYYFKPRV